MNKKKFELSAINVSLYNYESVMITDYKKSMPSLIIKSPAYINMALNKPNRINHRDHIFDVILFTPFSLISKFQE